MPTKGALGLQGDLARDAIVRECASGHEPRVLLERVAARLRPVVPYEGSGWLLTDPATMLYTDVLTENPSAGLYLKLTENELLEPDFAKFSDIVRQPRPVTTLNEATDGEPELSTRHRKVRQPLGMSAELRTVFATGGACWGVACLNRNEGEADFTPAETAFVASLCDHIANGLRTGLLLKESAEIAPFEEAPGMIVLGPGEEVESISDAAHHWLSQLPDEDLELPAAVHAVAFRARQAAEGSEEGVPRVRLRTSSGRWLQMHGACLRDSDGLAIQTAVVLEPARRAELAAIVVELYELSPREQQITQMLVRGLPIEEIAQMLWLSRHTVRDHVKAIFAKLGVSSRPELTAKLFAEQFLPALEAGAGEPAR